MTADDIAMWLCIATFSVALTYIAIIPTIAMIWGIPRWLHRLYYDE